MGKVPSTKKLFWARLGVSRPIYVNVDSPINLDFPYFNYLGVCGFEEWDELDVKLVGILMNRRLVRSCFTELLCVMNCVCNQLPPLPLLGSLLLVWYIHIS